MPTREPQWYKDAVIYEVHVRAFHDSVGEGVGSFRGLTQKLDYLHDLGVTAIWLLPFYPSPLRDDGYDIADYTEVHPAYGTLETFQEFLDAAHERGLRVITELVINHTSDQHPWFQRARRAPPGSPERDFYVWSDTPDRFAEARIIFKDFETSNWSWDPVAKAYYWHRFYSHQPDLNFDNPAVWQALLPVVDYWFEKGVDGLRLDAVPYLYERPGTNCENLPETHAFLKALRSHVDRGFPDRMLLAEANQWPEDAVAYFGDGNECHMCFHFPLMPRLFMAIHREDRLPVIDIMDQTPAIPDNCQWALFLRNHDELTLEMVTDEERDYMYENYAADPRARINLGIRHRLAPLLGNDRRRIELMNGLLFSLPGTPVLYYGDEIGMGDNIFLGDRNGVRTPMQWSDDRNAGFSRANPQRLYLPVIIDPQYHYETVNVDTQQNNPHSLLWWTKRLIGLRRRHRAFGRGSLQFLRPTNRRVLAFIRQADDETILVVANLSRFTQHAELDLSAFAGATPVELFGGTHFPDIGPQPYPVMLGPHSFHWFELVPHRASASSDARAVADQHVVDVDADWVPAPGSRAVALLEDALIDYLNASVRPASQRVNALRVRDLVTLPCGASAAHLLQFDVTLADGSVVPHWLPVVLAVEDATQSDAYVLPPPIARFRGRQAGWICDASCLPELARTLIRCICGRQQVRSRNQSVLAGVAVSDGCPAVGESTEMPVVQCSVADGARKMAIDNLCVLSLRPVPAVVPGTELELGRWLSQRAGYAHIARWCGALEFRQRRDSSAVLADLYEWRAHEGNAWQFTLDELSSFFERMTASPTHDGLDAAGPAIVEAAGDYLDAVRRMTTCLAELHRLTSQADLEPGFAPEEFNTQYQRSLYQSLRNLATHALDEVQRAMPRFNDDERTRAADLVARQTAIEVRLRELLTQRVAAWRVRVHGNFHLGQLLRTGTDYVVTGFESGGRAANERRIKRTSLRDLAGLLHSIDFASRCALYGVSDRHGRPVGIVRAEDLAHLADWTQEWRGIVFRAVVDAYQRAVSDAPRLVLADADFDLLIRIMRLEHALHEVRRQAGQQSDVFKPALDVLLEQL